MSACLPVRPPFELFGISGSGPVCWYIIHRWTASNIYCRGVNQSIRLKTMCNWFTNRQVSAWPVRIRALSARIENWPVDGSLRRRVLCFLSGTIRNKLTLISALSLISWSIRACLRKIWKLPNNENARGNAGRKRRRKQSRSKARVIHDSPRSHKFTFAHKSDGTWKTSWFIAVALWDLSPTT